MQEPAPLPRWVRFGPFEVDLQARVLRRGRREISLREKPFQLLAALLERPKKLLTREELRQRLWPDGTFVEFEDSLNHAVYKLREELRDSPEHPRFAETVPPHGSRLIALSPRSRRRQRPLAEPRRRAGEPSARDGARLASAS